MSVDDGLLRLKMQNGIGGVLKASKHNKRRLPSLSGADPERSHLNYALRGPATPNEVAALAKRLMADAGIHKLKRKDSITAIEVVSSLPVGSLIDPMTYFTGFIAFIEGRFGAHNILSADVHLDEAAPHCHILILPLLGNRLDASSIVGGRDEVNAFHAAFYAEFAGQHGLRRPPPRLSGNAKKAASEMVRNRLAEDADVSLVSSVWTPICEAIERYPEPFMAALGIQRPASVKSAKTFEQIVTSTGAGPKTAAGEASRDRRLTHPIPTPIGVDGDSEARPLPCVGVAQSAGSSPSFPDHPQPPLAANPIALPDPVEPTRHRDCDQTPDTWDGVTGEFVPRMPPPTFPRKAAADAGVRSELGQR